MPRTLHERLVPLALAVVLLLAAAACGGAGDDDAVLTIDGWTLTRRELREQLQQIADNEGYVAARSANGEPFRVLRPGTDEFDPAMVAEFLNERVTFHLAETEVRERGLTVTDEDRARAVDTIVAGFAAGTGAVGATPPGTAPDGGGPAGTPGTAVDGRAVLDAFGTYRDVLTEGVANLQVLQRDLTGDLTGDEPLRRLYEELKDTSATQACVRHILVQAGEAEVDATTGEPILPTEDEYVAALDEITAIRVRITGGEDFATVAGEVSDDLPTRASGGDLGCTPQGAYSEAFDQAVWTQEVGVVGFPVRSEYGYHLVLVTERGTLTFEEMRDDLRAAVDAQSMEAVQAWLVEAARSATVTVDPGAGTWDAATGLVKPVGVADAPVLDLSPEDPQHPSDDLVPGPSSTTTLVSLPTPTDAP